MVVDVVDVDVDELDDDVELAAGSDAAGPTSTGESSGAGWNSVGLSPPSSPDADTANAATATTVSAASNVRRLSGTSAQCTSHVRQG